MDGDSKPVRRIRLVPAPAAALTLTVNGLRRFAALAAGDTILLSRCEDALYFYVLAELYQYAGDSASRKVAVADAITFEDQSPETDTVNVPLGILFSFRYSPVLLFPAGAEPIRRARIKAPPLQINFSTAPTPPSTTQ